MKTLKQIDLDLLNSIQAEWMGLSSTASQHEKDRVFGLMKTLPPGYITGKDNNHNVMLNATTPMFANSVNLVTAKSKAADFGIRTDIAWNCSGEWINI